MNTTPVARFLVVSTRISLVIIFVLNFVVPAYYEYCVSGRMHERVFPIVVYEKYPGIIICCDTCVSGRRARTSIIYPILVYEEYPGISYGRPG